MQVSVHEAKLIYRGASAAKSPLEAMVGEFELPDGWDRPLSPDEADDFWEGKW
jgi:hypothetical protein